ncbi:MAG TPA: phenylalanine--tRNA ligase subunit beta [Acidimicrobiales bacterium]|nr:phenylalanine--tRNA ligase subunit beta [Acidimicrobiales bacterium]
MRVPLSWLRDFTPVEGSGEQIARTLSFLGLVVAETRVTGVPLPGIVVARVLATKPHPAADRIQLVDVDAGDGEALQVCCGAFNMRAGDLVPLATIGTVMPNGAEIGRRKMRGEWSNGMLCSAPELGLGSEGLEPAIMLLPPGSARPGQPAAEALGLVPDVIFDVEISPNRSDCFSVAGVARDLAAAIGLPFALPEPPRAITPEVPGANVMVTPEAAGGCPRFTGTVIQDADKAIVSPLVPYRLALAGMRAINPIVDVSNYVMLELGQPNHPYDIELLGGHGLLVRWAQARETIVTLDGQPRALGPGDLLIADAEGKPVGVAGIMGGASAEISPSTSTVLLEAANFDPQTIASTGRRLGLLSEARTRFERGVDIELAPRAVDRFAELLGSAPKRGQTTDLFPTRPVQAPVPLRTERANLVLGTALGAEQCERLLQPLGFRTVKKTGSYLEFGAPSWRPDCSREVDLIEEIARMYGYERLPRALPPRAISSSRLSPYQARRRRLREALCAAGLDEAWTTTFLSAGDLVQAGLAAKGVLELENPLDQSQSLLRTSLLPGLLRAVRFNIERQATAVKLFEVGNVFSPAAECGEPGLVEGVHEWEQLGVIAVGRDLDASFAVRAWEAAAQALRLTSVTISSLGPSSAPPGSGSALDNLACFHPGRWAAIGVGGREVGLLGELAPEVSQRYEVVGRAAAILVDLEGVLGGPEPSLVARAVSRFPGLDLDMAFVVAEDVRAGDLAATIRSALGDIAGPVVLFEVWRGTSLGEGRRSLNFRARLRAPDRTLTEGEVAQLRQGVAAAALSQHGAVLRAN